MMHHGQNRGKQKRILSQKRKLNENEGQHLAEIGEEFINFAEIGEIYTFFRNSGNMHYASLAYGDGRL